MNTNKIVSMVLMVVIAFSFLVAVPASAQVIELWSQRYDGGFGDQAWSVAVDSEDSVIVTGQSHDGTVYNYYTIKYDKNGIEQWSKTYDCCADYDMAFDVAVDSEDNVIVTGLSLSGTYDYYTIKYDKNDGHEIWSQRYDAGHGWPSADMAFEVAVDSEDNVIVAGWSHNGTVYNYYTIKYDKNGVEQWNRAYDGGLDDLLFELAIDSEDSVIVTGYSATAAAKYDYYTIKYNKNGVEQWSKRYDGSGLDDLAFYVATDSEDNVVVTGWSKDGTNYNYYTIKYAKGDGHKLWDGTYDGGSADLAWCVVVDSEDNVIVTGNSHDGVSYNYYTIKYGKDGNEQWNKKYDGGGDDMATGLAIDSNDNVIVTGQSNDGASYNYYTIKYDKNGNEIWGKSYDGGDDDVDPATAVDSENNVIVTGWSHDGAYYDYYTIKYSPGGPPPPPTPTPGPTATIDTATGTGSATLETTGGQFENVEAVAVESLPEEGKPPHVAFPHGVFSFKITGLTAGQSVTVRIVLPSDMPTNTEYWKFGPTPGNPTPHWYPLIPLGDNDGDNVLEITLIDGGLGDDDLIANGVIIDQGGPCNPPLPVPEFNTIGLLALIAMVTIVLVSRILKKR